MQRLMTVVTSIPSLLSSSLSSIAIFQQLTCICLFSQLEHVLAAEMNELSKSTTEAQRKPDGAPSESIPPPPPSSLPLTSIHQPSTPMTTSVSTNGIMTTSTNGVSGIMTSSSNGLPGLMTSSTNGLPGVMTSSTNGVTPSSDVMTSSMTLPPPPPPAGPAEESPVFPPPPPPCTLPEPAGPPPPPPAAKGKLFNKILYQTSCFLCHEKKQTNGEPPPFLDTKSS